MHTHARSSLGLIWGSDVCENVEVEKTDWMFLGFPHCHDTWKTKPMEEYLEEAQAPCEAPGTHSQSTVYLLKLAYEYSSRMLLMSGAWEDYVV